MLSQARRAAGFSQKALAADLGLHQTQLCAYERGRRAIDDLKTLTKLVAALRLDPADIATFTWAMRHDQIIASVERSGMPTAAPIVSLALQASYLLSDEEMLGLQSFVSDLLKGKRKLSDLAARSAIPMRGQAAAASLVKTGNATR
jgi:transcriptional regulator with XRE-family HTH domain